VDYSEFFVRALATEPDVPRELRVAMVTRTAMVMLLHEVATAAAQAAQRGVQMTAWQETFPDGVGVDYSSRRYRFSIEKGVLFLKSAPLPFAFTWSAHGEWPLPLQGAVVPQWAKDRVRELMGQLFP
jgi:hypothetical protein